MLYNKHPKIVINLAAAVLSDKLEILTKHFKIKNKKTMKKFKKLLSIALSACIFTGLATSAAALSGVMTADGWNQIKTINITTDTSYYSPLLNRYASGDTAHGFQYAFDQNWTYVLNQYTSSTAIVGTRVSSWKRIYGDPTQTWLHYYTNGGKYFLIPETNSNLFLEIYRTSTNVNSELIADCRSYQSNYYEDGEMHINGSNYLQIGARGNYNSRYLKLTNNNTPISDGNGTSKYCVWVSSMQDATKIYLIG